MAEGSSFTNCSSREGKQGCQTSGLYRLTKAIVCDETGRLSYAVGTVAMPYAAHCNGRSRLGQPRLVEARILFNNVCDIYYHGPLSNRSIDPVMAHGEYECKEVSLSLPH